MANISTYIDAFRNAVYGEDVRSAMIDLANALNAESSQASSDASRAFFEHSSSLASGTDLNTVTQSGSYKLNQGGYLNIPVNEAGVLCIYCADGYIIQMFYTHHVCYYRFYGGSAGWRAWKKLVTDDDYTDLSKEIIKSLENVGSATVGIPMLFREGYIASSGNIIYQDSDRRRTNKIACIPGDTITYTGETDHNSVAGIAFFDKHGVVVETYCNNGSAGSEISVTVPNNASYFIVSTHILKVTIDNVKIKTTNGNHSGLDAITEYIYGDFSKYTIIDPILTEQIYNYDRISAVEAYKPEWLPGNDPNIIGNPGTYQLTGGVSKYCPTFFRCSDTFIQVANNMEMIVGYYDKNHNFVSFTKYSPNWGGLNLVLGVSSANDPSIYYARISINSVNKSEPTIKTSSLYLNEEQYHTYKNPDFISGSFHNNSTIGNKISYQYPNYRKPDVNNDFIAFGKFSPWSTIYFDDTDLKLLIGYFDDDDRWVSGYDAWVTSSPCNVGSMFYEKAVKASYIKIQLRGKSTLNSWDDYIPTTKIVSYKNPNVESGGSESTASVYISVNGDDSNDGLASSTPLKTLSKAVSISNNIVVMGGVYPDALPAFNKNMTIRKYKDTSKVIFANPNRILATSATKVSDYSKVYSTSISKAIPANVIYQENVNDVSTLIPADERHPSQRGRTYRCEDTAIKQCSSSSLNEALSEIDSASNYKYFVSDDTLYFSSPQIIDSDHPLTILTSTGWISSNNQAQTLKLIGLEFKGYCLNLFNVGAGSICIDCRVGQVYGAGAFRWDSSIATTLIRCEAYRANSGSSTGDGFNAHADKTGDTDAKLCTCMLIECWSHDNHDDGYSDHECSEMVIYGGLYEHNGKAGVTPSYGNHTSIHDVTSQKNYRGFYLCGEASDGGVGSQSILYNCIAEGNSVAGFSVNGAGNSVTLYNCTSLTNPIGYNADSDTNMRLINCYTKNDTSVTGGSGTITIDNPTLVTGN